MESQLFGNLPNWVTPILTIAAAWGGIKVGLNGLREDVKETKERCTRIETKVETHGERIAFLEAKR